MAHTHRVEQDGAKGVPILEEDMIDEPALIIYHDQVGEFAELAPDFARNMSLGDDVASVTLQWPKAAEVEQKRRVLQFLITAIAAERTQQTLIRGQGGEIVRREGASGFLAAVDETTWWLGHVALLFRSGETVDMLWYPGSDGAFLHIGGASNLLTFRVVPAVQEICIVLDWEVVVD